jgi:hypothetical protein
LHRMFRDFGDQFDVFLNRETRNQIAELEHEADVFTSSVSDRLRWTRSARGRAMSPGRMSARPGRRGC